MSGQLCKAREGRRRRAARKGTERKTAIRKPHGNQEASGCKG